MLKKTATCTALLVPAAATLAEDGQMLVHGQRKGQADAQDKVKDSPMTGLIYRGAKHGGQRTTISRKLQRMIYRGVAHDGLPTAAMPVRNSHTDLCYRSIRYTLKTNSVVLCGAETLSIGHLAQTASCAE